MRKPVLAACAAALATLAVSVPVSAEEEQPDGIAVDIRAVAAVMPAKTDARALAVYRTLIPDGLEMPAKPQVGVWLSELSAGKSAPGRPNDDASHWLEGAIDIRVKHGAEEGWYPVHYPVTAEFWFNAGRAVGLPKRHADAAITEQGKGWSAQATPRGTTTGPAFQLDWQPGAADAAAVEAAYRLPSQPMLVLNAPLKGPDLERVKYDLKQPYPYQTAIPGGAPPYSSNAKADAGMVRVRLLGDIDAVNEDLPKIFGGASLGDIVDLDQTVPGSHAFFSISLNSTSEVIGKGSYPKDRPAPSGSGGTAGEKKGAAPRCTRARSVVVALPRNRAGRISKVRAAAGRRALRARLLRGSRARVDVRTLRAGRAYRIAVTGYGTHGRRVRVVKAVKPCA